MSEISTRLGAITDWLQHEDDELLYAPDEGKTDWIDPLPPYEVVQLPMYHVDSSPSAWLQPRRQWDIGQRPMSRADLDALQSFFQLQQGQHGAFRLSELPEGLRPHIGDEALGCLVRFDVSVIIAQELRVGEYCLDPAPLVEIVE